ncbi:MAG: hypothetical protein KBG21_10985 [Ignavibacteria bacterium]|nr:hypothetical protein [Ignavibacteria bacterium]
MTKTNRYILFLILPILYFLSSYILKSAQGPYYLNFYDPGYVYLISSLNIAQGSGVGHFDHPGTTVQLIGAVIIKIFFALSGKDSDISIDVLSRPEDYLYILNTSFILINSVVLVILGLLAYKLSKNIYLSLLLQLSPFTSMEIFYGSIIVSSDNFLIAVSLLFICALLLYWFNYKSEDNNDRPSLKLIIVFAVICGLGLATKLTFIPLVFIPFFLITGYKNRMYFWIFTVVSFLIFIFPILFDLSHFALWIENLVMKSGKYGKGDSNVVDTNLLMPNLKMIFSKDPVFTISYITLILTFVFSIAIYNKEKINGAKYFTKVNKIMLSLLFAITLQIMLVAKHYAQHYLIPSLMLSIFILIFCIYKFLPSLEKVNKKINSGNCFAAVFVLITLWSGIRIHESFNAAVFFRKEAFSSLEYIKDNYSNNMLISDFRSANIESALAFSVRYAAGKKTMYENIISGKNKSQVFYDPWNNRFYKTSNPGEFRNDILNVKKQNEKLVLQMYDGLPEKLVDKLDETCNIKNSTYKEVFSNGNGERIYEVTIGK